MFTNIKASVAKIDVKETAKNVAATALYIAVAPFLIKIAIASAIIDVASTAVGAVTSMIVTKKEETQN